jgi:tetratricopeptide (TPR) repeat protein
MMNRTDIYRLIYVLAAIGIGGIIAFIGYFVRADLAMASLAVLTLVGFLSIQIQHHFWRDHFNGRRAFSRRCWKESLDLSCRFIELATRQVWMPHLVWLGYMVTSRDIVAVTKNNVASAYMAFADYQQAESYLSEALARDPLYPLPHLNRAKILIMLKREDEARLELNECRRLGYKRYTWKSLHDEVLPYLEGEATA